MRTIMALVLAGALAPATAALADEEPQSPRIVVTGEGEAAVAPDMALVNLAVSREAPTAREALSADNEAMDAVLKAMRDAGIAERDLQTSGFAINPRVVYPDQTNGQTVPKTVGYEVVNTLTVRVLNPHHFGGMFRRPFLYQPR